MILSRKNAGKWVASKNGKVIATNKKLDTLVNKIETRKDRQTIRYSLVPQQTYFVG